MGKIIAITAGKGGSGKTTLTALLGAALAAQEKKVCLVDVCVGMRGLDMALHVQDKVVYDLYDLCEELCSMEQALLRQDQPALHMIAAPQLEVTEEMQGAKLQKCLERLKKRFDYVLLDTPGVSAPFTMALCRQADEIILVTIPGNAAARNAERAAAILREATDAPLWLLYNCYTGSGKQKSAPDAEAAYLDIPLLGVIPLHESMFFTAVLEDKTPENYPEKMRSAALEAAKRLNGENIPMKNYGARRFPWHS